jgi:hypothetical protein
VSTKRHRYGNPAKRRLVAGDLTRLVQPTGVADPRRLGGDMVGPGGPHDRGAVLLDLTDVVLMDAVDVCTVDAVRAGQLGGQVTFMTLGGRVNHSPDRVQVGFVFDTDGAAALITELLALADRHGPDMLDDVTRRLTALHRDKTIDLAWLRAAIDTAIDTNTEIATEQRTGM